MNPMNVWREGRLVLIGALFVLPAALGCLWVLGARLFAGLYPEGGWLWLFSTAVAPWLLLGIGTVLLVQGLYQLVLFRWNPANRRAGRALRQRPRPPGVIRRTLQLAALALMLATLVLWPRHGPMGVLVWESTSTWHGPVSGTERWEGGRFITDYADQKLMQCTYLTLSGLANNSFPASHRFPWCPYFYDPPR